MTNNKLGLNVNETDFIITVTSRQRSKLISSLRTSLVVASHHQTLYAILVLHLIAILISENISLWHVTKTIAIGLITNKLDYCNALIFNIAPKDILKLQCVQNRLARSARFSHSVPLLKSLHWLPVQYRIIFKLNHCLSNSFFWRTFRSIFHDFSNTRAQRTQLIWFSLVCCQG